MSELKAGMTRRIKLNSASVARQRVLKAEVVGFVDDMKEFAQALRRSLYSTTYQVVLVPLIGLQRRRADWSRVEGYVDEVFEWHGLIVGLSRKSHSRNLSPAGSHVDLAATLRSGSVVGAGSGIAAALSAAASPALGVGQARGRRQMGDDIEMVGERLGYFRCRDTDVFKAVMDRKPEIEMMLV
jgi:hypothetical protein